MNKLLLIFIVLYASSLFASGSTKYRFPYLKCANKEYIPTVFTQFTIGTVDDVIKTSGKEEKTGGLMRTYNGLASLRVYTSSGLVTGNANFLEVLYRGNDGSYKIANEDRVDTTFENIEINFYEYGYQKYEQTFLMIGLGYLEHFKYYKKSNNALRYKNPYFQIGVGGHYVFVEDWWIGLELYARGSFYGKTDAEFGFKGQTVKQQFSYGYKASLPLIYRFNKHLDFFVQGDYDVWKFSDTNTVNTINVPSSTRTQMAINIGIKLGLF